METRIRNFETAKLEINGTVIKRVSDFICLAIMISELENVIGMTLQKYNKITGIIKQNFSTDVR